MRFTRAFAVLALGVVVATVLAAGCATYRSLELEALPERSRLASESDAGLAVQGYTTRDGEHHRFRGRARAVGDSIEFYHPARPARGLERDEPEVRFRLERASVLSLDTTDPVRTGLAIAGVAVVFVALAGIGMAASAFNNDPLL